MPPAALLATLPVAASAACAIAAAHRGDRRGVYVFKPLTTVLVIAATWLLFTPARPLYRDAILLGLTFSLAGDVFLMLPRDRFVAGLAAFLLAQFTYAAAFTTGIGVAPAQWPWVLPFAALGFGVYAYLWPRLGALRAPVAVYVTVIVAMAWRAAVRSGEPGATPLSGLAALAGACLFLVSDSVLAIDRFRRPFRGAESVVLATYWAAQLLIGLSVQGS